MTPLRVTARLAGPVAMPYHPVALDALLAYAVCARDGIPPATLPSEMRPIEIPVAREPAGRFHLASVAVYQVEQSALRHVHKRAPVEQYQTLGSDRVKRVQITAGPNKSYRIPLETIHAEGDVLMWWCIGEQSAVRDLLHLVHHVGKRRGAGLGCVASWTVEEEQEPWDGFPVVDVSGHPLRNLPTDWSSVRHDATRQYATLTYPYWLRSEETLCAVP